MESNKLVGNSAMLNISAFISLIAFGLNPKLKLRLPIEPKDSLTKLLTCFGVCVSFESPDESNASLIKSSTQRRFGDCTWLESSDVSITSSSTTRRRFGDCTWLESSDVSITSSSTTRRFGDRVSHAIITVEPDGFTLISYLRKFITLIVWSFGFTFSVSKNDSSVEAEIER